MYIANFTFVGESGKGAIYSVFLCTLSIPHALSPALTDERVCGMERAALLPDTLADCYSASLENGDPEQ
ncbi:hypothetical protein PRIPAC_72338 [Pristionchus pacificus]|nr:hypothetical protein PRIPAC_72338 [Pristionchus pacificus]|eukprot:PDM60759.1 hypothetical protein PRIPAC_54565 [Pristionchus pacificus]